MAFKSRTDAIASKKTALLLIDLQNSEISKTTEAFAPEYVKRISDQVIPNVKRLIATCRKHGAEVIYTTIESLTSDGRDRSLDHKLSNMFIAKGAWEGKVIFDIQPANDDIELKKTSSGVFNSTNLDYLLRNLGIEAVLVAGVLTDQCVDMAIRDGADKGYFMICVEDACTSHSQERHDNALTALGGYCRISRTADMLRELSLIG